MAKERNNKEEPKGEYWKIDPFEIEPIEKVMYDAVHRQMALLHKKKVKEFSEYLLHSQKVKLAEKIKEEFNTGKGKVIALLLKVLDNKGLLTVEKGQGVNVFKALKVFFNRDIGTYNSVFTSFKYEESMHRNDLDAISKRVDFILINFKEKS